MITDIWLNSHAGFSGGALGEVNKVARDFLYHEPVIVRTSWLICHDYRRGGLKDKVNTSAMP